MQPTRSANTVAGISGVASSNARTRGSKTVNEVGPGDRSYLGGVTEFTALITVVREIPNRDAIRAFGTPSAASLLISAQCSKVITLRSLSAHFSQQKLFSFRAPPDSEGGVSTSRYYQALEGTPMPSSLVVAGVVSGPYG